MRYAQINDNNICFADSYLSGEVHAPNMIPLAEYEDSPLGKKYDNGVWIEVEQPQIPQPPQPESDTEIIMQAITDLELYNIEVQQQNELLAQQMTELELAMLERGNM